MKKVYTVLFLLTLFFSIIFSVYGAPTTISAPDIDVNPASVDFGNVTVNTINNKTIAITNKGNKDLKITAISTKYPAPPAEIGLKNIPQLPLILKPGEKYKLVVFFSPSKVGYYYNNVIIESNDPDESKIVIPLEGRSISSPIPNKTLCIEVKSDKYPLAFVDVELLKDGKVVEVNTTDLDGKVCFHQWGNKIRIYDKEYDIPSDRSTHGVIKINTTIPCFKVYFYTTSKRLLEIIRESQIIKNKE